MNSGSDASMRDHRLRSAACSSSLVVRLLVPPLRSFSFV